MPLRALAFNDLVIDDERSFAGVGLYQDLKRALQTAGHTFLVPDAGTTCGWDRAVFLNLTFWSGAAAADVLCEERLPADVVAHIAWHHLAGRALADATSPATPPRPSAMALFLSESIASAFDLYLVGRLLPIAPDAEFIASQVPLMTEAADNAGFSAEEFSTLLNHVVAEPERAFEDLRQLLFDACRALLSCADPVSAQTALESFGGHRFYPLLHHFELSNWILYARAHGHQERDARADELDAALRAAPDALAWLSRRWLEP